MIFSSRPSLLVGSSVICTLAAFVACEAPTQSASSPIAGYYDPLSAPREPSFFADEFLGVNACQACHPEHVSQWENSAHANAMHDPVFQALLGKQAQDNHDASADRFCTQCHSPIGTRSGEIKPGRDFSTLPDIVMQGVNCETCHRVSAIGRLFNSGHLLSPQTAIGGAFADPQAPHTTTYLPLLKRSEFCAGCHEVQSPSGMILEHPFQDWKRSPAMERGASCQNCHMPAYSGPATNLSGAPPRTLHDHRFTGVEVPLGAATTPEQRVGLEKASLALLQSALDLEILNASEPVDRPEFAVRLRLTCLTDGHRLPTGSSFFRQMWVAIEVSDQRGVNVFSSGNLDENGDLFDLHQVDSAKIDPNLHSLSTDLYDQSGNPTLFVWRAARMQDHSLMPLEQREISYQVSLGQDAVFPLQVRARAYFRPFAPRLLRELGLDEFLPHVVPVVVKEQIQQLHHAHDVGHQVPMRDVTPDQSRTSSQDGTLR